MGVAVFAPCLPVVVDGCFSLPVDAARRLEQLPKRLLDEGKMSVKQGRRAAHREVSENDGKNNGRTENTEG